MKLTASHPARLFNGFPSDFGALLDSLGQPSNGETAGPLEDQFGVPALDISESDDNFQLQLDLPGVKAEDVDIELDDDTLTIAGHRQRGSSSEDAKWHRRERREGKFRRVLRLPETVDRDGVIADYHDGVLTLVMPKIPKPETKRIHIRTSANPSDVDSASNSD